MGNERVTVTGATESADRLDLQRTFVDTAAQEDVAGVAACVLRDHTGQAYELTGPEAVDLDQVAAIPVADVFARSGGHRRD